MHGYTHQQARIDETRPPKLVYMYTVITIYKYIDFNELCYHAIVNLVILRQLIPRSQLV